MTLKIIECNLPRNGQYTRRSETTAVVLHHAAASSATVWDINDWHLDRGFNGIGYHYYVRKDGCVYRGRPEWALGAHAIGANDWSIGVCCEGDYMTEIMPDAQINSLKALLRDIMSRYGELLIKQHKEVSSTDCPGDRFPWAEVEQFWEEDDGMGYEQFKAFMERYEKEREQDNIVPNSAKDAWPAAKEAGIMDGTMPNAPATRAQLAVVLHRLGFTGK